MALQDSLSFRLSPSCSPTTIFRRGCLVLLRVSSNPHGAWKASKFFPPLSWGVASIDVDNECLYITQSIFSFVRFCDNIGRQGGSLTTVILSGTGTPPRVRPPPRSRARRMVKISDADADNDAGKSTNNPGPRATVQGVRMPSYGGDGTCAHHPNFTKITGQRRRVCSPLHVNYMRR